jgi:hypothetical protein
MSDTATATTDGQASTTAATTQASTQQAGGMFASTGTQTASTGQKTASMGAASTTQATTAANTPVPAWHSQLFTADGKINKAAYDAAPENVKKFRTSLEQYETPEALFHALGHNKSLVGAKGLTRLPADAPQEAKDAQAKVLREVLGVPDKPEGYGLKKPDQLPEGVTWDDSVVGKYAEVMHKHNLPPEAVQDLVKLNLEMEGERAKGYGVEQQKQLQSEFAALDKSLPVGTTREQYMGEASKGLALASKLTGIPEEELKANARTARDVKLFAAFAQIAGEDKLIDAASDTGGVNYDAKINELMNSKEYMHSDESVRGPVMAEVRRLLTLQTRLKK